MPVDPNALRCTLCSADFTFVRRRHWCRTCGRTICYGCSSTLSTSLTNVFLRRHVDNWCVKCAIETKQSEDDDSRAFSHIAPSDRDAFRFATIGLNLPEDEAWFATWHLMAETRAFLEELNYAILEGNASGDKWVLLQTTDIEKEFKAICSSSGGSRARLTARSGLTTVASIGNNFLFQCSNLTAIDLSGLTAVTSIGDWFLAGCPNLTVIDLSGLKAVTSIGHRFL